MNIQLIEADISEKTVLRQLLELYQYEFSQMEQRDLNEHGFFGYRWLDNYWTENERYPFVIRCDRRLAGFALVRNLDRDEIDADYSIAEFFVLRKYRRLGIGRDCALNLFQRFRGKWVLTVYDQNEAAIGFWASVINSIANDLTFERVEGPSPARCHYFFTSTGNRITGTS